MPTSSDPTSPGPCVTAIAARSRVASPLVPAPAAPRARSRADVRATPVPAPRRRICRGVDLRSDHRRENARPSSTTAAAVSSHDDSMPRILTDSVTVRIELHLSEFDYHLPEVIDRAGAAGGSRGVAHAGAVSRRAALGRPHVSRLPAIPARGRLPGAERFEAFFRRDCSGIAAGFSGAGARCLLVSPASETRKTWTALVHPGRKMRTGERVLFDGAGGGDDRTRRIRRAPVRFHLLEIGWRLLRGAAENRARAAAAVYQASGYRGGSRAIPDGVCARDRIGGGADGRVCTSRRKF